MMKQKRLLYVVALSLILGLAMGLYACNDSTTDVSADYAVKHFQQNVTDDDYVCVESDDESLSGIVGEQTQAVPKNYEGFTALTIEQKTIGAENTVVNVYYNRKTVAYSVNHYKQNQDNDEYTLISGDVESLNGRFGATTQAVAKTYEGYKAKQFEQVTIAADGSSAVNIYYDRLPPVYADYKVQHYLQDVTGDGYTISDEDTQTLNGIVGKETVAQSKQYDGFGDAMFSQTTIENEGTVVKLYYDRITYTISFYDGNKLLAETETRYGAEPVYEGENPKRFDGIYSYLFDGWEETVVQATEETRYHAKYKHSEAADEGLQLVCEDGSELFSSMEDPNTAEYSEEDNSIFALRYIGISNNTIQNAKQAGFNYLEVSIAGNAWWSCANVLTDNAYEAYYGSYRDFDLQSTVTIDISAVTKTEGFTQFANQTAGDGALITMTSAKFVKKSISNNANIASGVYCYENMFAKNFADSNGNGGFKWAQGNFSYGVPYVGINVERVPEDYSSDVGCLGTGTVDGTSNAGIYIKIELVRQAKAAGYNRLDVTCLLNGTDHIYYWSKAREWESGLKDEGDVAYADKNGFVTVTIDFTDFDLDNVSYMSLPFIMESGAGKNVLYVGAYFASGSLEKANYTVNHYLQNLDNDDYVLVAEDTETIEGLVGRNTCAKAKTYEGFIATEIEQVKIIGDGTTVVNVYYNRPTANYTVKHFLENASDNLYTEDEDSRQIKTAKIGIVTNAVANNYEGFTAQSFEQSTVTDSSVVIEIYYKRNVVNYTVKHLKQNTDNAEVYDEITEDMQILSGKFGTTTKATAKNYDGYSVVPFEQTVINADGSTVIEIKYLNVKNAPIANYTVKHYQQNLDNDEYIEISGETETLSDHIGAFTSATSKSFDGFTAKSFLQVKIEESGTEVIVYYDRNIYTIDFKDGEEVLASNDYKFGALPTYEGVPKKYDGLCVYTFDNWDKEIAVVTETVTYSAIFTKGNIGEEGLQLVSAEGQAIFNGCQYDDITKTLVINGTGSISAAMVQNAKTNGFGYLEVTIGGQGYWSCTNSLKNDNYIAYYEAYDNVLFKETFVISFNDLTKTEGFIQFCKQSGSSLSVYSAKYTKKAVSSEANYSSIAYTKDHKLVSGGPVVKIASDNFADNNGRGGFVWAQGVFSFAQKFLGSNADLTSGFSGDVGCLGAIYSPDDSWAAGQAGSYISWNLVSKAKASGFSKIIITVALSGADGVYYWENARKNEVNILTEGTYKGADENGIAVVEVDISSYEDDASDTWNWLCLPFIYNAESTPAYCAYTSVMFAK